MSDKTTNIRMQRGDQISFEKDGELITATIVDFAPRVFGGPGCNVETTEGWVVWENINSWIPQN